MRKLTTAFFLITLTTGWPNMAHASTLVSEQSINRQKQQTQIITLKNGVPLVYRQLPGSPLVDFSVHMRWGTQDERGADQEALRMAFATAAKATQKLSKKQLLLQLEEHSSAISCGASIESSSCHLATLDENWDEVIGLLADVVETPAFPVAEIELMQQSMVASIESSLTQPEAQLREELNNSFYGPNHPFHKDSDVTIQAIKSLKRDHLAAHYSKRLSQVSAYFTFVGALPLSKVKESVEATFSKLIGSGSEQQSIPIPQFVERDALTYVERDIPTSYITFKFNGPGALSEDFTAARLMARILSHELTEELRTRRSLTYSVYAQISGFSIGIGHIVVSTSKIKETLSAVDSLLSQFKNRTYSHEELEMFKTIYTTGYYLTLEKHSSIASALARTYYTRKSTDYFYDSPTKLAAISPEDIKRVARKYLGGFRIGVIGPKQAFDKDQARAIIARHGRSAEF